MLHPSLLKIIETNSQYNKEQISIFFVCSKKTDLVSRTIPNRKFLLIFQVRIVGCVSLSTQSSHLLKVSMVVF